MSDFNSPMPRHFLFDILHFHIQLLVVPPSFLVFAQVKLEEVEVKTGEEDEVSGPRCMPLPFG